MENKELKQEAIIVSGQAIKEKKYWKEKLSGEIEKTTFPYDSTNEALLENSSYFSEITGDIYEKTSALSTQSMPLLYMILTAALKVFLFKINGQEDIIVGSPIETQKGNNNLINSILPLRVKISNDLTFKKTLLLVRETIIEAVDNQNYPFEVIFNELKNSYNPNHINPLFDVAILLENIHEKSYLKGSDASIIFSFNKVADKINFEIDYKSNFYRTETIKSISQLYLKLLRELLFNLDKPLKDISLLSNSEKEQIVYNWNSTHKDYPSEKSVIDLFEERVKISPNSISLIEGAKSLTYYELNQKSNELANYLVCEGISKNSIIGILLDRSIEYIVSVLGVLKAGNVFLPIDTASQDNRIQYLIEDSECSILITQKNSTERLSYDGKILLIDDIDFKKFGTENPIRQYSPEEIAYIIYTSGTTGKPKGTLIPHKGFFNYISWAAENYVREEEDSFPFYTSVAFDLTLTSVFTPLVTGNTIVIYNGENNEVLLEKIFEEDKVSVIKLTPSHLKLISNFKNDKTLKRIKRFIVGGEQLKTNVANDIFQKFSGNVEILNEYGPTEATVGCMIYSFNPKDQGHAVPIGKPAANTQIYILDKFLEPVPIGFQGELYIAGAGLAKGYYKKPELTATKFIDNPFIAGEKMYKSGDLAKMNSNNDIEFVGRIDQQVKIRGFRVELGEIENKIQTYLNQHSAIENENNEKDLELNIKEITQCKKCLLPVNYEEIKLDENGVCSICNEFESYKEKALSYFKTKDDFISLLTEAKSKNKSKYDCLLLFSGGKDSTYVLHQLVKMGLNVLTFTYDNGFISNEAFENIRKITKKYNVESIVIQSENMKEVLCESLRSDHNVCNGCFKGVNTVGTKIAKDYGINVVISGLSRGQIFEIKLQGLYKLGIRDEKEIEEKLMVFRREYHSMNTKTSRLLNIKFEDHELDNIQFVDYFRYDDIKTRDILGFLIDTDKSWNKPADTGTSSSNCMINDVGIYVHYKDKGYHFYAAQSSWECRLGVMTRDEGIAELKGFNPNYFKIKNILNEIGYYSNSANSIVIDKEDKNGDKFLCTYFVADNKIDITLLRQYLSKELPDYMIPLYFMQIDKIPLTQSGKINKNLLPEPKMFVEVKYIAARNNDEEKIVKIWADVLGLNQNEIGVRTNFFELGGHSLKATMLVAEMEKGFDVKIPLIKIFENPTVEGLANYIKTLNKYYYSSLKKAEPKNYFRLSSAQLRLYFLYEFNKASLVYNMLQFLKLTGNIHKERINNAFKKLISRHESLRTCFEIVNDEPVQKISEQINFDIEYIQASENSIQSIIEKFVKPFDLKNSPLLRVCLVEITQQEFIMIVDMHHIITDGVSNGILIKDFMTLYNNEELPELVLQYKDYAEWQQSNEQQKEIAKQQEFWLNEFAEDVETLDLPIDFPRPAIKDFKGGTINFNIDKNETSKIKHIAKNEGTTLFTVILSFYNILLSKLGNNEDIVIGVPTAGRQHSDLENMIGMFVNTITLRNSPKGDLSYVEFLSAVKSKTLECFDNQSYQFEDLIDLLKVKRDTSRNPLFDVMFSFQNYEQSILEIPDLIVSMYQLERTVSRFDLTLMAIEKDNQILFSFDYSTALFKRDTIERFVTYFKNIISSTINDLNIKISDIEVITEKEECQILIDFNNTKKNYPDEKSIITLFDEQVVKTPEKIALNFGSETVTYKELNNKSERIASYLHNSKNIGVGDLVGVFLEREEYLISSILGTLKAGAAYVPIDLSFPKERVKSIIENSKIKVIITRSKYFDAEFFDNSIGIVDLDKDLVTINASAISNSRLKIDNNTLAYIIFTSGTTGKPKGVMITHKNLLNYVWWAQKVYVKGENVNFPLYTSIAFDLTVTSIFTPLVTGNSIVIYKESDPILLLQKIIDENKVGVLKLTPSHLKIIRDDHSIKPDNATNLKRLIVGGEDFEANLAQRIYQIFNGKVEIYNEYGPTEATVGCMIYQYDPCVEYRRSIPIGIPIDNTEIYILDKNMKYAVPGVAGELYIAGEALSKGYYNDENLTKDKFIKIGNKLLYKSGDLVRWIPANYIEFLGRIDNQVKIRGFRVELGEIESQLSNHNLIKESVVIVKDKGEDRNLVAYYVSEKEIGVDELRIYLSDRLPDYMIPTYFVWIPKLPLTPNGKVNLKVLPDPKFKVVEDFIAPTSEMEEKLAAIWSEVLNVDKEQISINRNFFDLGGHSLKAVSLISKIERSFGVKIQLAAFFNKPTISGIGEIILISSISNKKGISLNKVTI